MKQKYEKHLGQIVDIPQEQWDIFNKLVTFKSLAKNEFFVRAGEACSEMAYIMSGLLRSYHVTESGNEFIRGFAAENSFVAPFASLLFQQPSTVSIQAIEDSEIFTISQKKFTELFEQHPCWEKLARIITEKICIEKSTREHELLVLSAPERYDKFVRENPNLNDRIMQIHLSAYLGISPITLSRIINGTYNK